MKGKKWIFIGAAVIFLVVFLILLGVFYPRYRAKSDMSKLLRKMAGKDVQYVRVIDPSYERPDFMDGYGRELALEGELLSAVQAELSAFAEELHLEKTTDTYEGEMSMYLLFKTADGTVQTLYVKTDMLYIAQDGKFYYFSVKDSARYEGFYQTLLQALSQAE